MPAKDFINRGPKVCLCFGGNAGLAVAYTGKLGVPVTIVVPESTTQKQSLPLKPGAQLLFVAVITRRTNTLANTGAQSGVYPFIRPLLWEGHASLVDE